jgi:hypothetical protein
VRDGHAGQLAALAFGDQGVGRLGLGQGGVFIDGDKSAQVLVLLGAGQKCWAASVAETCLARSCAASSATLNWWSSVWLMFLWSRAFIR